MGIQNPIVKNKRYTNDKAPLRSRTHYLSEPRQWVFGDESQCKRLYIDVIESNIERVYEVPGIGKKRVEKISESWEKQKEIKNVMLFLQGYGVRTGYDAKIYRQYRKESTNKVKDDSKPSITASFLIRVMAKTPTFFYEGRKSNRYAIQ